MVYLVILVALLFTSFFLEVNSSRKVINTDWIYNIFFLVFVLLAGLRNKVGGDSFTYQYVFEDYIKTFSDISYFWDLFTNENVTWEPFFIFSLSVVKSIGADFWFFQLLHGLFINVVIFSFIKKYTNFKFTALLFYAFFYFLYFNTEIMRESVAVCIFMLAYPYLKGKDYVKYYCLSLLAIGFHTSALILIVLPFLQLFKLDKKGVLFLVILLGLVFFSNVMFSSLLSDTFGGVSDKLDRYANIKLNINGMIFTFGLFVFMPYVLIKYFKLDDKGLPFSELLFTYFLFAVIFVGINGLGRFINYLGIFMIIYICNAIYVLKLNRNNILISKIAIILAFLIPFYYKYSYYNAVILTSSNSKKIEIYYPYYSIFENNSQESERYKIYKESMSDSFLRSLERNSN